VTVIAITGGIATGKTRVLEGLAELLQCPAISCDPIVRRLYGEPEILEKIRGRFGESLVSGGTLDRGELGRHAFANPEDRRWLEDLLHPRVLQAIETWKAEVAAASASCRWALVEVPLLYEVDFPLDRDIDVVVGCSLSTQLERIGRRDQLDEEQARSRIGAQLPIEQKLARAEIVLWNDGSESVLNQLLRLAADRIQKISS